MKLRESHSSLYSMVSRFINQILDDIGYRGDVSDRLCHLSEYFGYDSRDIYDLYRSYRDDVDDYTDYYDAPEHIQRDIDDKAFSVLEDACPELAGFYRGYARAMSRRRPESVLPAENFFQYALSDDVSAFVYGNSALLGRFKNGYFKVSHFCPSGMREGLEMLEDVASYDNIIFTVTCDLAPMLLKIGLYGDDKAHIPMIFRDELVWKSILTTDRDLLKYILTGHKKEALANLLSDDSSIDFRSVVRGREKYGSLQDRTYNKKERLPMRAKYKKRNGMSENILDRIIDESIICYLNEQVLYHCTPDEGKMRDRNGIWLSNEPDPDCYGKYAYRFDIDGLKIADQSTSVKYVKKYDIRDFEDVCNDIRLSHIEEYFESEIESGNITPQEAYEEIDDAWWEDVLTDPYEYYFPRHLKDDGYDGYMFEYDGYEYYYIFYPEKCKFLGKYDEEDIG